MRSPQYLISGLITAVWVVLYVMAAFVDRTLEALAQSVTPVMLPVVGFLLGRELIAIRQGKGDEHADT